MQMLLGNATELAIALARPERSIPPPPPPPPPPLASPPTGTPPSPTGRRRRRRRRHQLVPVTTTAYPRYTTPPSLSLCCRAAAACLLDARPCRGLVRSRAAFFFFFGFPFSARRYRAPGSRSAHRLPIPGVPRTVGVAVVVVVGGGARSRSVPGRANPAALRGEPPPPIWIREPSLRM